VREGGETATGTTAVYRPATQKLVLTGAVTLVRGPSQLSGDKLVYDIASGNAQVTNSGGPVKARFVPQGPAQ
jgi:lipopolysaccharide transport protein LptA